MNNLHDFITSERERFSVRHDNLFAFAFSQISRYYDFLKIIQVRYQKIAAEFIENSKSQQATFQSGTHSVTEEQMQLLNRGREITTALHLEIESYYLFAKILLDKISRAVEFYFGQSRGLSLDSHNDLIKNFEKYIAAKELTALPNDMKVLMQTLKESIADYRDKEIAHEKSPRTMKATMFSHGATSTAWVASTKIYPKEGDKQVESREIDEVMGLIDKYIRGMVKFVEVNNSKTALKLGNIKS